jgi:hypothetical protein
MLGRGVGLNGISQPRVNGIGMDQFGITRTWPGSSDLMRTPKGLVIRLLLSTSRTWVEPSCRVAPTGSTRVV